MQELYRVLNNKAKAEKYKVLKGTIVILTLNTLWFPFGLFGPFSPKAEPFN